MADDEKTERILDASLAVFCQYGFGKTTMQDIAHAAGISRAALYLHFKSKEDLFLAGSERAHLQVRGEVDAALAADGDVIDRIDAALTAYLGGLMEEISTSVHGAELFGVGLALTGEISRNTQTWLIQRLSEVLDAAAAAGEIDLSAVDATPDELAALILGAVNGIKDTQGGGAALRAGTSLVMRVLRAALIR
ncbi:TetR family transcriptional regulator [Rhodococcus sp. OK611]|uniref:TetR/AcrR family transcriptional regulator n=1 Tax=unclassified Rhodococcus (in: high G+C Gram-positive bacteria) TaxID=192944 RepID=UPI000BC4627E|nr:MULTISPECIES: TetR/AcrR family transcriptional regulator [unclassified Rhodococcus (in: high G+C Gram-positive bacteria)]PTR37477.1 TetR family transcriptional regulator [Rhodococcus sp. OK611]SNX93383.1 transcriptional regulator, TetR family [Rhodococcus sp. OK270]